MSERLTQFAMQLNDEEIRSLRAENKRLRLAIRRLAEQDATLSVQEGNVTVTMDATLTDEERSAIEAAIKCADLYDEEMDGFASGVSKTLRGLLVRTA